MSVDGVWFLLSFLRSAERFPVKKLRIGTDYYKLRLERRSNDFHVFVGSLSYYVRALSISPRSSDERTTDISTCDVSSTRATAVRLLDAKVLLHLRVEPVVASQQPQTQFYLESALSTTVALLEALVAS